MEMIFTQSSLKTENLYDWLGSTRQIINTSGSVVRYYTYEPFGEEFATECTETIENPFKFTGQFYDPEIDEYYLRARQYDPHISRFTSRDSIEGDFEEPLTLHKYLYCENDPINMTDPEGEDGGFVGSMYIEGERAVYAAGALGAAYALIELINQRNAAFSLVVGGIVSEVDSAFELGVSWYNYIASVLSSDAGYLKDPTKSPGKDWEWRGKGEPGSDEGNWHNPKTKESLHPHNKPSHHGPHSDYKDPSGKWWRVYPDGTMEPK